VFDIRTHLNGPIIREAVICGTTGRVWSRFAGEFGCHWDGNRGGMHEVIRLPEKSGGHVLNTVDWMYLAPNTTIVNRSQFRKYGVKVAELVATMRPARAEELKEAA